MEGIYKVERDDVAKASVVLADAFRDDPIWKRFLKPKARLDQRGIFFQSPLKFCLKYGEVWATSDRMEGIVAWVPSAHADMTLGRLVRSGSVISGLLGLGAFTRLVWRQAGIFAPMQEDRRNNMKGRAYLYLLIVGVGSRFQGQGFGTKLLRALIEKSEQSGLPLYLETETEGNVRFYEKLGFTTVKKLILPVLGLPMWEMVREPGV